ncbi:MAG TPA: hypothetical protein VJO53_13780 [Candidatus Acidoferrales bacterium]|nr:hypothetical protein [Candidatus Acidoferrales bacterium]
MAGDLSEKMAAPSATSVRFPAWVRWAAIAWLLIWIPAYGRTWGAANFLHVCDIAVILACIGVWSNSALLISSQTVSSLLVDAAWTLDAGWRLFRGRNLIGGTEYLFDASYPLWIRLLTLFHIAMPVLLLWALQRIGYDRRGWALQCAIALPAFVAARFTSPAVNINYAFTDPFVHRAWGPAPVHVMISWLFMAVVIYFPTHAALKRFFPPPQALVP